LKLSIRLQVYHNYRVMDHTKHDISSENNISKG
jgi:hypothetical protein